MDRHNSTDTFSLACLARSASDPKMDCGDENSPWGRPQQTPTENGEEEHLVKDEPVEIVHHAKWYRGWGTYSIMVSSYLFGKINSHQPCPLLTLI